MASRHLATLVLFSLFSSRAPACGAGHDVLVEEPKSGRALSSEERSELQRVADDTFHEASAQLTALPKQVRLIVRFGKDVVPETGENGTASYPGNVAWTVDPDRDVLAIIRKELRPSFAHELHHLARNSVLTSATVGDRVIAEGLATAFERDLTGVRAPWAEPSANIDAWTREVLSQFDAPTGYGRDGEATRAFFGHGADGRNWVGVRVGTHVVDLASRASGKSAAALALTPTAEILRMAHIDKP